MDLQDFTRLTRRALRTMTLVGTVAMTLTASLAAHGQPGDVTALIFGKKELTLKARSQGELVEIRFDEGQRVKAGQVLAQVDSRRAKIDLELARAEYLMAKKDVEGSKKLKRFVAKEEITQKEGVYLKKKSTFESKELDLANTQVLAPSDGIVTKKYFDVGESVSVGDKVFELVQLDELVLIANVDSKDARSFVADKAVEFRVDEYPQKAFKAKVSFVSPVIDAASDTVKVKFTATNPRKEGTSEYLLKPGMIARLKSMEVAKTAAN